MMERRLRFGTSHRRRPYYGWRVVSAGALLQLLITGLFTQAYGAYVVSLQADLGWSTTLLATGFAMARTESALLGPAQGHLLDRFGPQLMVRLGVILFGIGFVLLSLIQHEWQFFAAVFSISMGASLAGGLSVAAAVVSWFAQRRTTALGMAAIGFSLGGILVPGVAALMTSLGWRTTARISGALVLIVGPLLAAVVRGNPATGDEHEESRQGASTGVCHASFDDRADKARKGQSGTNFTAKQAVRMPVFWQIAIGHTLAVMLVSALMMHVIPHVTIGLGYSLKDASLLVAFLTAVMLVGQVSGGLLGDRVNKQNLIALAMIMHASAALLLSAATKPAFLIAFAILHGLAWGARGPLIQAWRADAFGSRSFGAITGYSSLIVMIGAAGGPIFAALLFDHFGDYTAALRILALTAVVGSLIFARRQPPATSNSVRARS